MVISSPRVGWYSGNGHFKKIRRVKNIFKEWTQGMTVNCIYFAPQGKKTKAEKGPWNFDRFISFCFSECSFLYKLKIKKKEKIKQKISLNFLSISDFYWKVLQPILAHSLYCNRTLLCYFFKGMPTNLVRKLCVPLFYKFLKIKYWGVKKRILLKREKITMVTN